MVGIVSFCKRSGTVAVGMRMRFACNQRASFFFILLFLLLRKAQMVDLDIIRRRRGNEDAVLPLKSDQEDAPLNEVSLTQTFIKETRENLLRAFGLRRSMLSMGASFKKRKPHDYMLYIYEKYGAMFQHGQVTVENTVRGCIDIDDGIRQLAEFPHLSFKFDISEIPDSEILVSSELKVLVKRPVGSVLPSGVQTPFFRVEILGVLPRSQQPIEGGHKPVLLTVKAKTVEVVEGRNEHWETFDVSGFVSSLRGVERRYVKFLLRAYPMNSRLHLRPESVGFSSYEEETKKALLVLFTDDVYSTRPTTSSPRHKREAADFPELRVAYRDSSRTKRPSKGKVRNLRKQRKRNKSTCRIRKMQVDFSKFGWDDWVVSPSNYSAFYCGGSCKHPISANLQPTNHATIQSIVHGMNPDFIPPPCCVPSEYQKLAMLYLDGEDRIVYKQKDDLIVKQCACR